ncbi:MAG: hypothetical protein WAW75_09135 [Gallionella sp.]
MNDEQKERDSLLSSSTSVSQYLEMEKTRNQEEISKFIYERFHERYIKPFDKNPNTNGFIMMASACLMIESLESFWQGWSKSPHSALAFCQFFDRNSRFLPLRGYAQEFYAHVRCGIMHQGETTGGWHIRRDIKVLFDSHTKTIDAKVFLSEMDGTLKDYCTELKTTSWESGLWKNFRKKLKNICTNTQQIA